MNTGILRFSGQQALRSCRRAMAAPVAARMGAQRPDSGPIDAMQCGRSPRRVTIPSRSCAHGAPIGVRRPAVSCAWDAPEHRPPARGTLTEALRARRTIPLAARDNAARGGPDASALSAGGPCVPWRPRVVPGGPWCSRLRADKPTYRGSQTRFPCGAIRRSDAATAALDLDSSARCELEHAEVSRSGPSTHLGRWAPTRHPAFASGPRADARRARSSSRARRW